MTVTRARHGDVELAYEAFGPTPGEPMVLVMALGLQMLWWDEGFCRALAERGFRVARFDNRDAGLSTHFRNAGSQGRLENILRPRAAAAYRLEDMADDVVAVLDALDWESAHVVGFSMGGMIGQMAAIRHPSRLRSLTVLCSLPGWRLRRMRYWAVLGLARKARSSGDGPEEAARLFLELWRVAGSPLYPLDEVWVQATAKECYERDQEALFKGRWSSPISATERQAVAVGASGDLVPHLSAVRVPTLVVHGDADPIVRASASRAIAKAIPGARLVSVDGLGHALPRELWPPIIDEICGLIA